MRIFLQGESDVDSAGDALMDEFSDCLSAYIAEPFDGQIDGLSVVELNG